MIDLAGLEPPPAGFPSCSSCPYLRTGRPAVCFACANAGAEPGAEATTGRCPVCAKPLLPGSACDNAVCTYGEDREFARVHTVTHRADDMWDAISRYKYDEDRSWAEVLARILVGCLDESREELGRYDVITTCALYVGPRANRLWDHLRLVLDAAGRQAPEWPFVPDVITKSAPSGRFLGISPEERKLIAEGELRSVLDVPDPALVAGRRVLVLDDVYSEGFSLREMARVLRRAGAAEVSGLVFARRKGG